MSVTQQCFCGEFMSPAVLEPTPVFLYSARYFCLILIKIRLSQQRFIEVPIHIKVMSVRTSRADRLYRHKQVSRNCHRSTSCSSARQSWNLSGPMVYNCGDLHQTLI